MEWDAGSSGGWGQVQRNRLTPIPAKIQGPGGCSGCRLQDRRDFFPPPDQFFWLFFFFFSASLRVVLTAACVSTRGEAVPLRLGGLRLEVRTLGRAHATLPETHGPPAVPVSEVRPGLFQVRPPRSAHEEALMRLDGGPKASFGFLFFLPSYFQMNKTRTCLLRQDTLWHSRQESSVPLEARLHLVGVFFFFFLKYK